MDPQTIGIRVWVHGAWAIPSRHVELPHWTATWSEDLCLYSVWVRWGPVWNFDVPFQVSRTVQTFRTQLNGETSGPNCNNTTIWPCNRLQWLKPGRLSRVVNINYSHSDFISNVFGIADTCMWEYRYWWHFFRGIAIDYRGFTVL